MADPYTPILGQGNYTAASKRIKKIIDYSHGYHHLLITSNFGLIDYTETEASI